MSARDLIENEGDGDELKREILSAVPGETFAIYVDGDEVEVSTLIFKTQSGDRTYLWGEGETSDVTGPAKLSGVVRTSAAFDKWFLMYNADSMWPSMYAINAESFEDAYTEFVDMKTDDLKIEDADLADYDEDNLNYNSNGVPVDTDLVGGEDLILVKYY